MYLYYHNSSEAIDMHLIWAGHGLLDPYCRKLVQGMVKKERDSVSGNLDPAYLLPRIPYAPILLPFHGPGTPYLVCKREGARIRVVLPILGAECQVYTSSRDRRQGIYQEAIQSILTDVYRATDPIRLAT